MCVCVCDESCWLWTNVFIFIIFMNHNNDDLKPQCLLLRTETHNNDNGCNYSCLAVSVFTWLSVCLSVCLSDSDCRLSLSNCFVITQTFAVLRFVLWFTLTKYNSWNVVCSHWHHGTTPLLSAACHPQISFFIAVLLQPYYVISSYW